MLLRQFSDQPGRAQSYGFKAFGVYDYPDRAGTSKAQSLEIAVLAGRDSACYQRISNLLPSRLSINKCIIMVIWREAIPIGKYSMKIS
jgi:hypothetical protein